MKPLMPSPGNPNTTLTPQSMSLSTIASEEVIGLTSRSEICSRFGDAPASVCVTERFGAGPTGVQTRKLLETAGEKTYVLIFETGDEVVSGLQRFASEKGLGGSRLTAIGAFQSVTIGYFNWQAKQYESIDIDEQVEVLSLLGDVAVDKGEPKLHAHVVVGKRDGTAHGGHLMKAIVRPTLEVMLTESPHHLQRRYDPESGLALIRT
jgi:uncharacterized protein